MSDDQRVHLTALLERCYGARVAGLRPIADYGEAAGGVYRVERRDAPSWVVRLSARGRPLERVHGDAAVLAYVGHHGVPAERLVRLRDGSGATDLDGQGVLVTEFVAGRRPDRSLTTLRRLGDALGRLHALPPVPAGDRRLARRAGSLPAEDLRAGRADLARIAERVPPQRRPEYEALRAALEATDDCASLPVGLTHSDCHLDNAILTPDGRTVLIDWVGAGQGPRVAALGVLLYSCAVCAPGDDPGSPWAAFWRDNGPPPSSGAHLPPEPEQMQTAIAAVIDGYCCHHRLTPAEREHVPHAVRFRPVVIAAREFAASIDTGTPANPAGWWTHYAAADVVAAYAQQAMERYS